MVRLKRFRDRADAGRQLAALLTRYAGCPDVLVLALPRGGVPVAFVVAQALGAPLDVFLVRKLGLPGQEELALGAVASGDVMVLNEPVLQAEAVSAAVIERVAAVERRELRRRELAYRADRPPVDVRGRTVILVDDGLATGSSMRSAVSALRRGQPARLVVAVPVAARDTCEAFHSWVDEIVCVHTPHMLHAISVWYEDFSQTSDDEVRDLLRRAESRLADAAGAPPA
jgi:predicted phosphoribosyltransferase